MFHRPSPAAPHFLHLRDGLYRRRPLRAIAPLLITLPLALFFAQAGLKATRTLHADLTAVQICAVPREAAAFPECL